MITDSQDGEEFEPCGDGKGEYDVDQEASEQEQDTEWAGGEELPACQPVTIDSEPGTIEKRTLVVRLILWGIYQCAKAIYYCPFALTFNCDNFHIFQIFLNTLAACELRFVLICTM